MVSPLIAWLTMPLEPSETIRPTNTLTPLNASVSLPGRWGNARARANSQSRAVVNRRVIWAVSGCTHGRLARSRSTCLEQHPVELHNEPRHHDDQRDGKQVGDRA